MRAKIDQKMQAKREAIGASIFNEFWTVLGAKLGRKIEQKSIKKGIEKKMRKRRGSGEVLGGPGAPLEGENGFAGRRFQVP